MEFLNDVLLFIGGWVVVSICLAFFLGLIASGLKRSVEK